MGDRVANSKSTRKKKSAQPVKRQRKNTASRTADAELTTYKLPAVMDLVAATSLKEDVLEVTSAATGLAMDASDVEAVATPCIQIIVATGLAMEAREQKFRIEQSTEVLRGAFGDLGLSAEYERWSEAK